MPPVAGLETDRRLHCRELPDSHSASIASISGPVSRRTQSRIDYVAEALIGVAGMKDRLRGYCITKAPAVLRPFTAVFEPLSPCTRRS
jgi:tryptophanase